MEFIKRVGFCVAFLVAAALVPVAVSILTAALVVAGAAAMIVLFFASIAVLCVGGKSFVEAVKGD